jgi:hypothetical protein
MATINGTFNSLIAGTLSGTVATPGATGPAGPAGPAGPTGSQGIPGVGVPVGGTAGQVLAKVDGVNYNTEWIDQSAPDFISSVSAPLAVTSGNLTVNLAGYATETFVTSQGYITSAALVPYLTKADNLGSLTNFATARDNLNLGTLNNPTFAGLTLQGSGANVGQYTPTSLSLTHTTLGSFVISPSSGITFPDMSVQTTAFPAGSDLPTGGLTGQALVKVSNSNYDADWATITSGATWGSITGTLSSQTDLQTALNLKSPLASPAFTGTPTAPTPSPGTDSTQIATTAWVKNFDYAQTNSPQFTGNPRSVTPNLSDDDTSIATTAFVKGQNYLTSSALTGYALLSGATFTGKVNFTPVSGVAGLNVGIGGTAAASLVAGDLWLPTGSTMLQYRDATGVTRNLASQNVTNTFSSPQIIDTTNASPALRVTQKGTGNAIQVEDSTTPDATSFVVDQFGKVGIGTAPDAISSLNLDANGLRTSDGINTAALTPTALVVTDGNYSAVIGAQGIGLTGPLPYIGGSVSGIQQLIFIDGTSQSTASSGGIPEAPQNGSVYARQDATWVNADSLYYSTSNPSGFLQDAPSDGNYYVRKDGAWYQCTVVNMYDPGTNTNYNFLTV